MRLLPLIALLLISAQVGARSPITTKYQQLELEEITVGALQEKYKNGETSAKEVIQAYLERIEAVDFSGPQLNSIIAINPDALKIAAQLDREFKDEKIRGALHGVPIVLKDNIDTLDPMPNTAGANVLKNSFPKRDAFIVQKLKENGAIILAKANLSEWANFHSTIFSSGWSAVGGQTKNPYDLTRNPCGSSSGSAASVSANLAMLSIGTDTEGSITCPASNNGIVGIRPTVGLLSRSGIIPISQTTDTPGPMARNLTDAVIALGAMVGIDQKDSATRLSEGKYHQDYTQFLKKDGLKNRRIGIYKELLGKHFRIDKVFKKAISFMRSQGAEIIEIEKLVDEEAPNFTVLLHEFKDGVNKYLASLGKDAPVKDLGEVIRKTLNDPVEMKYFDHNILVQAQETKGLDDPGYLEARKLLLETYGPNGIDRVMSEHKLDALVSPTNSPAGKTDMLIGEKFLMNSAAPAARAGYPHITVPMGQIEGLPVNISFFGRAFSEPTLIEIAYSFEQGTRHRFTPKFLSPGLE